MDDLLAGRYMPLEPVGRGTVATVWRAFDGLSEEIVALKVPHPEHGPRGRRELFREMRTMLRLRHPLIVRPRAIEALGASSRPMPVLVLDYHRASPATAAPQARTRHGLRGVAVQALRALAHLHERGFVHRDLKPANLLVGGTARRPEVTLIDFGSSTPGGRTDGGYAGTPAWSAPEVLAGAPPDARADLYSLGMILHRLGGAPAPFDEEDPLGLSRWLLDPRPLDPGGHDAVGRLVRGLTQPDARRRPATARSALARLDADDDTGPVSTAPGRPPRGALALLRTALSESRRRGHARAEIPVPGDDGRQALLLRAGLEALRAGFAPIRPVAPGGGAPSARQVRRALRGWVSCHGPMPPATLDDDERLALALARPGLPPLALLLDLAPGELAPTRTMLRRVLARCRTPRVVVIARPVRRLAGRRPL